VTREYQNEIQRISKELGISVNLNKFKFGFFLEEGEVQFVGKKVKSIKIDKSNWIKNLKHELRHVWQVQVGLLNPIDRTWKGEKVRLPYGIEPWELDAKSYSN
jgi:hypothetical protein